jgi:hypothetical protein
VLARPSHARYLDLVNVVSRPLPPMPVAALGPPVLVPLGTLVRRARVMLLGSAGVHLSMLGAIQRLRLPYKRAASPTFAAGGNTAALWLRIEVVRIEQHATATGAWLPVCLPLRSPSAPASRECHPPC